MNNIYCVFLKQVYFCKKFIKMDDLKKFFENVGFDNVKTVFTSGNIIINSDKDEEYLKNKISDELAKYYFYDIDVFVMDLNSIEKIINNNPFELEKGYYNQVFLCNKDFEKILFEEFSKVNLCEKEKFGMVDGVLYWKYKRDKGVFSNILKLLSRNSLKHGFTLRTIGTLNMIVNKNII